MKKNLLLVLLIITVNSLVAQEQSKGFSLELQGKSIFQTWNMVNTSDESSFGKLGTEGNFNLSALLNYTLNDHAEVGIGFGFSSRNFRGLCSCLINRLPLFEGTLYDYSAFEIPIQFRYKIRKADKRLRPFLSLQIITKFERLGLLDPRSSFVPLNYYMAIGIAPGVGVDCRLTKRFSFSVGVQIQDTFWRQKQVEEGRTSAPTNPNFEGLEEWNLSLSVNYRL